MQLNQTRLGVRYLLVTGDEHMRCKSFAHANTAAKVTNEVLNDSSGFDSLMLVSLECLNCCMIIIFYNTLVSVAWRKVVDWNVLSFKGLILSEWKKTAISIDL